MGMDLKPIRPAPDAPRNEAGGLKWGRYNWAGWSALLNYLEKWEVDGYSELSGMNDGAPISEETCRAIAEAILAHAHELETNGDEWLIDDAILWHTCGGYEQW